MREYMYVMKAEIAVSPYEIHELRSVKINNDYDDSIAQAYDVETIRAERFVNERGETIYIGISKQVQEVLGLPFKCFRQSQDAYNKYDTARRELDTIRGDLEAMSLWDRIKFVFTGYVKL